MPNRIICFVLAAGFIQTVLNYAAQINISSATTATVSNFYQDFSYCSCDRTPSLCDNYCCCDSLCSSATIASWTNSYSCITTSSTIEYLCNQSSKSGYSSFNDFSCVYYTNRGSIGYFYQNMQAATLNYPTVNKFSAISPSSISQSLQNAVSSARTTTGYTASNQYLLTSSSGYFLAPQPGPGGFCVAGLLNATSSKTSSCYITVTAANCAALNSNYAATLCLKGDCTSNYSGVAITQTTAGASSCSSVLTGFTVAYSIASNGTSYVLSSANVTPTYRTINYGSTVIVNLAVAVSSPPSTSGNPGYQVGKSITINPSITSISDPTTGTCTSSSGASLNLLFGQPATYSCLSPSPCSNSYYIDSLAKSSITLQKYASQSNDTITVAGTSATGNGCNNQVYSLQIVYSYDGWALDPQFYIVGASLSASTSPDSPSNPPTKYLSISWVYANPESVSSPPSNLFYTYFNYLWTPLKQKFGLS